MSESEFLEKLVQHLTVLKNRLENLHKSENQLSELDTIIANNNTMIELFKQRRESFRLESDNAKQS